MYVRLTEGEIFQTGTKELNIRHEDRHRFKICADQSISTIQYLQAIWKTKL